jgi:hypothetical protein
VRKPSCRLCEPILGSVFFFRSGFHLVSQVQAQGLQAPPPPWLLAGAAAPILICTPPTCGSASIFFPFDSFQCVLFFFLFIFSFFDSETSVCFCVVWKGESLVFESIHFLFFWLWSRWNIVEFVEILASRLFEFYGMLNHI